MLNNGPFLPSLYRMIRRYDTVNARKLGYLAKYGHSIKDTQAHARTLRKLSDAATTHPNGTATIPIDYERRTHRLYAAEGPCLQRLDANIRNFLVPDGSVDIDVVNSAPTVIQQLCRHHSIPTPCLDAFLVDTYEKCKEAHPNKPSKFKNCLLFYSGDMDWETTPGWARTLRTEVIETIYPGLRDVPAYSDIHLQAERTDHKNREEAEQNAPKRRKRGAALYSENVSGIFLSHLYFFHESKILTVLEETGRREGYWTDHLTLMFDGLFAKRSVDMDLAILERAVADELGLQIKLAYKPFKTTLVVDINQLPPNLVVDAFRGDEEAADLMVAMLRDKVVKVEGILFAQCDGRWTDNQTQVKNFILGKTCEASIETVRLNKEGEEVRSPYTCMVRHANHVVNLAMTRFPERKDFVRDIVLESEGKLAFIDGFWRFTPERQPGTGVYGEFVRGETFDTAVRIEKTFPHRVQADIDFVMETFFNQPFLNTPAGVQDRFLLAIARACAGHMDKVTNIMVGGRDSSKSVIMQFLRHTLGRYTCTIPSGIFAIRGYSGGDAYRDQAWVFDAEHARIGAISEATQTTVGETVFSGDTLKKFQSIKEGMSARKIRQDPRDAFSLVTGFMLLNDIPRFEPADAIEKCHIYNFPNRFVNAQVKADNPFSSNYIIAEPKVEQWLRQPHYQAALLWIIFEAYRPEPVEPTEDMKESAQELMEETGIAMYDRMLDITLDPTDKTRKAEVHKHLKKACAGIGPSRVSRDLQEIINIRTREANQPPFTITGFSTGGHTNGRYRVYKGIKIRNDMNQDFDGGYANGFQPIN